MKPKKKMNLKIDCDEISEFQKSIFSQIGNDGLRFLKQGIQISKEGIISITGELMNPLYQTTKQTIQSTHNHLGQGAACIVQQGIYLPLNKKVAIKSINIYDKNKRHQIMNDIKILLQNSVSQNNSNDFIIELYGAYFDQGLVKVILQFMDGGSLDNIISMYKLANISTYLSQLLLIKIAVQILCAISYLHSNKKIHRDIKPGNILINTKGQIKLSDFGISRQFICQDEFSKTAVGSKSYMSPERLLGHLYSYQSDIWGFGLVLYQLATSKYPFPNKSEFQLLKAFETIGTPSLPKYYSQQFNHFLGLCLAIDPEMRPSAISLLGHPWIRNGIKQITLEPQKCSIKRWLGSIRDQIIPLIGKQSR